MIYPGDHGDQGPTEKLTRKERRYINKTPDRHRIRRAPAPEQKRFYSDHKKYQRRERRTLIVALTVFGVWTILSLSSFIIVVGVAVLVLKAVF